MELNTVYYKSSKNMSEIDNDSVDLIVTSPPYFNIKDYGEDDEQVGDIGDYNRFIESLLEIWIECERVLKPNGKLVINTPLMPMTKSQLNTHYNRHIFDINSDIQHSILYRVGGELFLLDTYIWNRVNATKSLMFGSYPYPSNFYAQNTSEFITIYVKKGKPINDRPKEIKEKSKLTKEEWVTYTKQIRDIPIPNKSDIGFGKHPAIMPEEIVKRCVKLYSFVGDIVLDPFAGSGTTLKVAKELGRNYIGYEIIPSYKETIDKKLGKGNLFE